MTKTALLKFLLAIVITFILILPEYFKTPEGNILELSCLEVRLQPNLTYSLSSLNFSLVTFLEPVRETETIMRIFLNHSNFQNFTRMCQDITSEFTMCSLCLVCESEGNKDFISQEQTSKVLIMRGSMEAKENDFHSPCQQFNFTVAPTVDRMEEYNITCNLKANTRSSAVMEEDPTKAKSMNHTCRIMNYPNNCTHISLHLEVDVKNFYCSMKITWYTLVILVFVFLIIFTIYKILEVHRQRQKWRSHKYKPSVLLRKSDSEKLPTLNVRAVSGAEQRLPFTQVKKVLSPIPELEVPSMIPQQEQHMRQVLYIEITQEVFVDLMNVAAGAQTMGTCIKERLPGEGVERLPGHGGRNTYRKRELNSRSVSSRTHRHRGGLLTCRRQKALFANSNNYAILYVQDIAVING
ncbi:transmembrane protein 156 [Pteronotus mesoamericanus]|uniref:transmembrane protein 156 n=1 Tax=Pteronotus mesoamericanus TaxID=1884717 RepID=UPI0023EA7CE0|nr:transmembrane protein 156 [Pteronotus parnellii mesoamericanus]